MQNFLIDRIQRPTVAPLSLPERLLLGPGPSNAHPVVLEAMNTSPIGHLDPAFLTLMDEIQSLLRYVWQTQNPLTIAVSGTGTAAMEATIANAVEPGVDTERSCSTFQNPGDKCFR
jgi:alanine-glyoxylate transaminase / serine-glyoxylate transaminase / serine-pyruvate transaminase